MQPLLNPSLSCSLEQEINSRIGDFDIISLLRLLKLHKYDEQSLWFSSHNNIASQNRLIESVNIDENQGYVFIELNIGILASTGILPEHMRKFMDRSDVNELQLQRFFQLYDHLLILSYLGQLYPEINRSFFDDWQHTVACYTQLQNMRSKASLHWLLNTAFPEFENAIFTIVSDEGHITAETILGQMTLGQIATTDKEVQQLGFRFYMQLRPEWNNQPFDWQVKTKERIIEWIIPWLRDFSIEVEFYLSITRSETHLKLRQQSVLGYDPFYQKGQQTIANSLSAANYTVLIHKQTLPDQPQKKQPQTAWEDSWRIRV
jgi:hypothetical protein